MGTENWKDVRGYEGLYMVSDKGRVKSLARTITRKNGNRLSVKEKILKLTTTCYGYHQVSLHKDKKGKLFKVHRIVAEAFIENEDSKPEVNHIDGIKSNNEVSNLEWVTSSENKIHAYDVGLKTGKLSKDDILFIKNNHKQYSKELGTRALANKFNVGRDAILEALKRIV